MSFLKPISTIALVSTLALALASCSTGVAAASLAPAAQEVTPKVTTQTQTTNTSANGGIIVVGSGQVSAAPDIAQITLGVETTGSDVQDTMDANSEKMTALLNSLKSAGVAEADIRTTNFNLYVETPSSPINTPDAATTSTASVIYHVSNQVEVTVRDLSKLGATIDSAVAAGANSIYGVNYSINDPAELEQQARTQAVADAKARAQALADLEGVTLGSVVSVQEMTSYNGPVYAKAMDQAVGGGTPIQSGTLQVSLSVQVTYAIQ